ncbi:DUF899-domain-containing protein [Tothia fuscella]|uniref:DUF899-domain-containing protein n=1 Tax=Tothia fuscella TaxID=1048955 RepID=A0A9P4NKG7_9PEZI|nr:DUF899-domain-containing protein [Tothia fuscella]
MKSYTFTEGPSDLTQSGPIKETTLEDLAADGRTVLIRHYMWDPSDAEPCPHCCSALDAWDAMAPNLADRVTFVIVAKAEIERFRTLGTKRNWKNLRLLSSFGSDFNREMNVESVAWTEVKQLPGLSVFKKDAEGVVRHFYTDLANYDADTIGYDFYGGYRNFFDFAPEGRGGF